METRGKIERISNEQIKKFKQVPCNNTGTGKNLLKSKLDVALKLGNIFKSRCRLVFNTTLGKKTVYTTIWNVTDEYVELKDGTTLLITSIEDIRLV